MLSYKPCWYRYSLQKHTVTRQLMCLLARVQELQMQTCRGARHVQVTWTTLLLLCKLNTVCATYSRRSAPQHDQCVILVQLHSFCNHQTVTASAAIDQLILLSRRVGTHFRLAVVRRSCRPANLPMFSPWECRFSPSADYGFRL